MSRRAGCGKSACPVRCGGGRGRSDGAASEAPSTERDGNSWALLDTTAPVPEAWTALLQTAGVTCVRIPAQSPNCNPHAERFVKTIRTECLDHFVIFGERHLRYLVKEFMGHYLAERYHQGIGSRIIKPKVLPSNDNATRGAILCRSHLGGLLNYYYREAA